MISYQPVDTSSNTFRFGDPLWKMRVAMIHAMGSRVAGSRSAAENPSDRGLVRCGFPPTPEASRFVAGPQLANGGGTDMG